MRSRWILDSDLNEKRVRVIAPAKINLFLKVNRKLVTGYHEIESLMVPATLADILTIVLGKPGNDIDITCDNPTIPTGEDNLVYQAVQVLRDEGLETGSVSIHIRKRIPAGAGLGGGSSNAAATLKGIDFLNRRQLPRENLRALGLKIGADVPFFFMEQACLVTGIGEGLNPVEISCDIWLVIAFPGISISTREAYQALDSELTKPDTRVKMPCDHERGGRGKMGDEWQLVNHLETPVFLWYPFLRETRDKLISLGAAEARMTGSGSSIFGVFRGRETAAKAMTQLRNQLPEWKFFLARPVWQGADESWRDANGSDRGKGFSR